MSFFFFWNFKRNWSLYKDFKKNLSQTGAFYFPLKDCLKTSSCFHSFFNNKHLLSTQLRSQPRASCQKKEDLYWEIVLHESFRNSMCLIMRSWLSFQECLCSKEPWKTGRVSLPGRGRSVSHPGHEEVSPWETLWSRFADRPLEQGSATSRI